MELRLQKFIEQAIGLADVRNLSPENPIQIGITAPNSSMKTIVVVAINEPWQYINLPANVTWINYNPQDPYFKRALKRVSRTKQSPTATYQHTWQLLDRYIDVFEPPQYYDQGTGDLETMLAQHIGDHNNPHAVTSLQTGALPLTGGQMTGSILARQGDVADFVNAEELIPKKVVDTVQQSINSQIQDILDSISGSPTGSKPYKHEQITPHLVWTIPHQLGTTDALITVYGADGEQVSPEGIDFQDNNTLILTFVTNEAGKAYVFKAS